MRLSKPIMTDDAAIYPSLRDRAVLVTGGANGIGAEITQAFSNQGAQVAFLDTDDLAASRLIDQMTSARHKPVFRHCNLTDVADLKNSINTLANEMGSFEILINNAGCDDRESLNEITLEKWDYLQNINLRHVVFASQTVFPGMAEKGCGVIINFSSPTFRRRTANLAAYASAKAAIEGLSRVMSREMGKSGVRVNTIMPGWTMTDRQRQLWLTPEAEKLLMETQCLKTHVMPEDISRMVLFLSSDDARVITAQTFIVDAGLV